MKDNTIMKTLLLISIAMLLLLGCYHPRLRFILPVVNPYHNKYVTPVRPAKVIHVHKTVIHNHIHYHK